MTNVHTYEPLSEVVRGENVRVGPSVEILWSGPTTDPFTVQITCSATATSTDELRVESQDRLSSVPATSGVLLNLIDGVGVTTGEKTTVIQ